MTGKSLNFNTPNEQYFLVVGCVESELFFFNSAPMACSHSQLQSAALGMGFSGRKLSVIVAASATNH